MKKIQEQDGALDSKVLELVKPRKIEGAHVDNGREVESLCSEYGAGHSCGGNGGIEEDDLLF